MALGQFTRDRRRGRGPMLWGRAADPNEILTSESDGLKITYTTAAPHGLSTNDTVTVTGSSQAGHNVTSQTITVTADTTFEIASLTAPASGTGGRWALG